MPGASARGWGVVRGRRKRRPPCRPELTGRRKQPRYGYLTPRASFAAGTALARRRLGGLRSASSAPPPSPRRRGCASDCGDGLPRACRGPPAGGHGCGQDRPPGGHCHPRLALKQPAQVAGRRHRGLERRCGRAACRLSHTHASAGSISTRRKATSSRKEQRRQQQRRQISTGVRAGCRPLPTSAGSAAPGLVRSARRVSTKSLVFRSRYSGVEDDPAVWDTVPRRSGG